VLFGGSAGLQPCENLSKIKGFSPGSPGTGCRTHFLQPLQPRCKPQAGYLRSLFPVWNVQSCGILWFAGDVCLCMPCLLRQPGLPPRS